MNPTYKKVPLTHPLPKRQWLPSGDYDGRGKPLFYSVPWDPFTLGEALSNHFKLVREELK